MPFWAASRPLASFCDLLLAAAEGLPSEDFFFFDFFFLSSLEELEDSLKESEPESEPDDESEYKEEGDEPFFLLFFGLLLFFMVVLYVDDLSFTSCHVDSNIRDGLEYRLSKARHYVDKYF